MDFFAGLVLSWFGDVFLISRTEKPFLIGLVAFLLGHVAFLGAFFALEVNWNPIGIGVGPLVLVSALVTRWLLPHAPREMRIPIVAYILVITAMVAAAFGLWQHENGPLAIGAALCFFLSDLSVAINRFVSASFVHRLWGLPLYYLAQILFGLLAGSSRLFGGDLKHAPLNFKQASARETFPPKTVCKTRLAGVSPSRG